MPQRRKQSSRLQEPVWRGITAQTILGSLSPAKVLWERYSTISQVLIVYAISLCLLLWLYSESYGSPILNDFLNWNAEATGFFARIFSRDVIVQDNLVMAWPSATKIVPACTSLAALATFFSGVIAFPTTLIHKLWGIVLGLVVLSAVNILRTTSLVFIDIFFPAALDVAHILVWQSFMIIVAAVLWILWWRRANGLERLQS